MVVLQVKKKLRRIEPTSHEWVVARLQSVSLPYYAIRCFTSKCNIVDIIFSCHKFLIAELKSVELSEYESDVLSYLKEKVPADKDLSENIKEFVKEHMKYVLFDSVQAYHTTLIQQLNNIEKDFKKEFWTTRKWCMIKFNITDKDLSSMKIIE
ncbi:uncharacterized protein LOC132926539 [Rhopalosiphum padi]|uniref:uncharacterized protein LOC132926539 n=1 Tax=Rhopalosiphum padi TaxID=40932 RepID=UPI00298E4329|nr:uncharacterized protein LOC132926539 [Rhopalosiphum padi]